MRKDERVARLEKKATVSRIDTLCICQFYSDYKGCTCKEAYAKIKATGRELTIDDFYKMWEIKNKEPFSDIKGF